jgi:hypothetical protein
MTNFVVGHQGRDPAAAGGFFHEAQKFIDFHGHRRNAAPTR